MRKIAVTLALCLACTVPIVAHSSHSSSHHGAATHSYHHPATPATRSHHSYYTNSSGHRVHTPVRSSSRPSGATAECSDGSYSLSEHHGGTCSHHGGVSKWIAH